MRFCPVRNCFTLDIPKNKFYTKKKVMHFIFMNKEKEVFYDDTYEKVFFFNEYVHKVDFSIIDKNLKLKEEQNKKEKEKEKNSSDINNISTEDEKEISQNLALTPTPENSIKFKFDIKNQELNEDDDEYSGLRPVDNKENNINIKREKRYESFDVSYNNKTKLKSILKDSNPELLRQRRSKRESFKKVSFGKTETLCFK